MRIKYIIPYFLSVALLVAAVAAAGADKAPSTDLSGAATYDEPVQPGEMKGVWVTFMTLDVENESDKESAFSAKIDAVINDMKSGGFNTVFVHVRPFCDALYRSAYYPWSHIITGEQGKNPGFDPLKMICDKCGENDISVHAWLNPYRISTGKTPPMLSADNPYSKDSSIGVEVNGELYLDPASQKARELIVNGVKELLKNYRIDGIHFDDYFYPENCGDFDKEAYEEYKASADSPLSLEDFRKENVNILIREVYKAVHSVRKNAMFGIAPQGNMPNNEALYADVRLWCREPGYVDYICPQIYFSLDNPAMSYEAALEDWLKAEKHSGLRLYVGLPGYKAGTDADSGTWLDNNDILKTEIEILREKGADGFILYSYDSLHNKENAEEIQNVIRYINSPEQ